MRIKAILIYFLYSSLVLLNLRAQSWRPFGSGLQNNSVLDLGEYNGLLYAVGGFYSSTNTLDRVVVWDGTDWNPMDSGAVGIVDALAIHNGEPYIGGSFMSVPGNNLAKKIARWDGNYWTNLNAGVTNGNVDDLVSYNGELYVVGNILSIDNISMIDIGKWNGTIWAPVCTISGGLSQIFSVAVFNGELYIGGYFSTLNSVPMYNIAKFDGVNWSDVGGGVYGDVRDMFIDSNSNRLYISGNITSVNGGTTPCPSNVAFWDGNSWNVVGNGPNLWPRAICVYQDQVIIGLNSLIVNNSGDTLPFIAKWDGTEWRALGKGVNCSVNALTVYNNELIVGGCFTQAGDSTVSLVAAWSDTTTSIYEIEVIGNEISIHPHPVSEFAFITLPEKYSDLLPLSFEVFDLSGRIIFQRQLDHLNHEVKFINSSGKYVYKIFAKGMVIAQGQLIVIKNH